MDLLTIKQEVQNWENTLSLELEQLKALKNNMILSKSVELVTKSKMKSVISGLMHRIIKINAKNQEFKKMLYSSNDFPLLERKRQECKSLYLNVLQQIQVICKALPKGLTKNIQTTFKKLNLRFQTPNERPDTAQITCFNKTTSLEKVKDPMLSLKKKQQDRSLAQTTRSQLRNETMELLTSRSPRNYNNSYQMMQNKIQDIIQENNLLKTQILELKQNKSDFTLQSENMLQRIKSIEEYSTQLLGMVNIGNSINSPLSSSRFSNGFYTSRFYPQSPNTMSIEFKKL